MPWHSRIPPYTGIIVYDTSGWMSVQIAGQGPPLEGATPFGRVSPEQRLSYLDSYYGYFGRFELDERAGEVRHFVEMSLDPTETRTTLVRKFELSADRLTLTTPPHAAEGEVRYNRLVWSKV